MKRKSRKKKVVNFTLDGLSQSPAGRKLFIGGVLAGAGFIIYRGMRWLMINNNPVPVTEAMPKVKPSAHTRAAHKRYAPEPPKGNDAFPLKIGSEGARVVKVQMATEKLGAKITLTGKFDLDTAERLNTVGFPAILSENKYNELLSKAGISTLDIVFNPQAVSKELHVATAAGDIDQTLSALRKIREVQGYEAVKTEFIKTKVDAKGTLFPRTVTSLVNGLLEVAFKDNEAARKLISQEFFRMGLKRNPATNVWSLTGLMNEKAMVFTITDTTVTDALNKRSKVAKGTKLGRLVNVKNNMVFFRDSTQQMKAVPYNTIRYEAI